MKKLGKAVLIARRKRGFTQKELAEASGITQGFLSKIENGVKHPYA